MSTPIYLRNRNTGEIHRVLPGGFTREICNLDDMKKAEEVTAEQYEQAGDKRCAHCQADEGGDESG